MSKAEDEAIRAAAAALGKIGGSRRSAAKTQACRENGLQGGRPSIYLYGIFGVVAKTGEHVKLAVIENGREAVYARSQFRQVWLKRKRGTKVVLLRSSDNGKTWEAVPYYK